MSSRTNSDLPADIDMPIFVDDVPNKLALLFEQMLHVDFFFRITRVSTEKIVNCPIFDKGIQLIRVYVVNRFKKNEIYI